MAQKGVTISNGKDVMMRVIDGDDREPTAIASELGYIGPGITDHDLKALVVLTLDSN